MMYGAHENASAADSAESQRHSCPNFGVFHVRLGKLMYLYSVSLKVEK